MNDQTQKFLDICTKYKITTVSIGTKTKRVESAIDFPFHHCGSAFADGEDDSGWPRIWAACKEAEVAGGCGNHGQYQLKHDHGLDLGVYCRHHKTWSKVEP